jgi:hypothetical protein
MLEIAMGLGKIFEKEDGTRKKYGTSRLHSR